MNLQRVDYMVGKMRSWDKSKMELIITILEPATESEMEAAKEIAAMHGWKTIEVRVDPKPCTGISVKVEYINPEDEPKREHGKIYA